MNEVISASYRSSYVELRFEDSIFGNGYLLVLSGTLLRKGYTGSAFLMDLCSYVELQVMTF